MRKIIELVKYQMQIYFRGNQYIMPLVLTAVVNYGMYSIAPADIVSCFSITCYFVFMVMAWIGFSVSASENVVVEQIQLLRVQSVLVYYISKVLFFIVLGVLLDCICLLIPILIHVLNHMELFRRQLTGYDVLNAFILLSGCSFVGGALGSLLHPNVMKDRKAAALITILAAVLTIIRTSIVSEIPFFKFISWIFPPLDKIFITYGNEDYFRLAQTCGIFVLLLVYGVVYSLMKSVICCKRKYS